MVDSILLIMMIVGLAAISPGPDIALIVTRSLNHGWRAGVVSEVGIALGLVIHLSAVGLGLVSLLILYPWLLSVLKIAGALYLVWIAFCLVKEQSAQIEVSEKENISSFGLIRQGFLTNVLNPKALIFFVSVFPQLIESQEGHVGSQVFILSASALLAAFIMHSLIAILVDKLGKNFIKQESKFQKYQNYLLAFIFICFAVNLLLWEF